jgi:hypothetical protein
MASSRSANPLQFSDDFEDEQRYFQEIMGMPDDAAKEPAQKYKPLETASDKDEKRKAKEPPLQGAETLQEASDFCRTLIHQQLEKARIEQALPNVDIPGDRATRATIALVLPDRLQRQLFLEAAADMNNLQRLRPLFGAPPYQFLSESDAGLLRAAGFSSHRVNMAYDAQSVCSNYSQFGAGQLVDEHSRCYRLASDTTLVPGAHVLSKAQGDLQLQVKVVKRSLKSKIELSKSMSTRKALMFPLPGEEIVLFDSPQIMQITGQREISKMRVRVKAVAPRGSKASTASVLVTVI